jgi:hypothetical protein
MATRNRRTALQGAQRKYLRGPVIDAELRAAAEQRLDGLPDSAFAGERVRSFVAVSSWFWYCYPCVQPNDESDDSRAKTFSASLSQFHPSPGVENLNSQLEIQRKFD